MQRAEDPPELVTLFDAVFANPADDTLRLVLADALGERSDPRGEFIMLQLGRAKGGGTPRQLRREELMLNSHWRTWLKDLPGVLKPGLVFERGFAIACRLRPQGVGVQSPTWRSVEQLDVVPAPRALELTAPALSRLEVLTGLDSSCLQLVLEGPERPRLKELALSSRALQRNAAAREQQQVLELTRFPSLQVLELGLQPQSARTGHTEELDWLLGSKLAKQLKVLRLRADSFGVDLARLRARLETEGLEALVVELIYVGMQITLEGLTARIRFDNDQTLMRYALQISSVGRSAGFFPYERFEVWVGEREAWPVELRRIGYDEFRSLPEDGGGYDGPG